jgi:hypothetical protein
LNIVSDSELGAGRVGRQPSCIVRAADMSSGKSTPFLI